MTHTNDLAARARKLADAMYDIGVEYRVAQDGIECLLQCAAALEASKLSCSHVFHAVQSLPGNVNSPLKARCFHCGYEPTDQASMQPDTASGGSRP